MANPDQRPNPEFLSGIKTYESCLGKGGFGVVLKAIDTSGTPTAIKFIFMDNYGYQERQKLLREYNVTKDLDQHPNIVTIIDVQEKRLKSTKIEEIFKDIPFDNLLKMNYIERANKHYDSKLETFCIQMELCGENLRKWLNEKHDATDLHIQIRQTRIIQGMISGLKYLHNNKIIHRDLKPENIMFSTGRFQLPIKIGDFGHCRRVHSEESETGSLTTGVGTTLYMAPDVYSGEYDHQADIYSIGLIIWEVSQLIRGMKRRNFFDKLVNDKKVELVEDHAIMAGIKEMIIGLTKRQTTERTKTLDDIHIDNWDQELLNEIQNQNCSAIWKSISSSEMNLTVKTSQELKLCLDNAQPGCIINLMDGEYFGSFVVNEDSVQIVGNGSGTVLQSNYTNNYCLTIVGSGCTISNLNIINCDCGIIIEGSQNTIKQVKFNGMKVGIGINGSQNTVDDVTMTNLEEAGIYIFSNGNTISNISGQAVKIGIWVSGSNNNSLTNINFQRGTGDGFSTGVKLGVGSSYNNISHLTCIGYSMDKEDWGLSSLWNSSNSTVADSACGPVELRSSNSLTLRNVDCGEFIKVDSECEGLKLINCRGKRLQATKTVVKNTRQKDSGCQFEELITD